MRILVLHRIPDSFVHYADNVDHDAHEVTYVSEPARKHTLPEGVPARRLERPGDGDTAAEVLEAVAGLPTPDVVVALSEFDLLPAAQVREALGVPGDHVADVLPARDKVMMKTAVAKAGLRVPRFLPLPVALAEGAAAVPWHGRTILKPLAGATSEGVARFATVDEALEAARRAEPALATDDFEIEEFIDGELLHIDGLMMSGKPAGVLASRYMGSGLSYAEGNPLGSVQTDTEPDLVDWVARCLNAIGIDDCPFHLEAFDTPEGPVFLEVGARFGGADVVDCFELATGVRLPSAHLRLLIHDFGGIPAARTPEPHQRYGWFTVPGHTLGSTHCRITGEQPFRDDPLVVRWVQREAEEPISRTVSYADSDIPLAGVVGPATEPELRRFLTDLLATVRVEPAAR
ncbi:ATP-grasp domain-containing protein [Streptomyces odontomachi]|uniref:ATP-grasp domain-containing protein n=1 Tax=Streptomyces odontomachi TaxID=2944940 RepID=UPI00210B8DA8|nr:ATP-grasp domain-containing protein [Streptomyces sp. ODS25]